MTEKEVIFHFIFFFIFNFLGMVAPQLKRNCFTGGHAFKYSKNLINDLKLISIIKKKEKIKIKRKEFMVHVIASSLNLARFYQPFLEFP